LSKLSSRHTPSTRSPIDISNAVAANVGGGSPKRQ
jgi:hypothetical protein